MGKKAAEEEEEKEEVPLEPPNPLGDFPPVDPPGVAKLRARLAEIEAEYFERYGLAAQRQATEEAAALFLQSRWRGFIVRSGLRELSATALYCQRVWRGYLGRQRFREQLEQHNKRLREAYFAYMATSIQRVWRGYLSRKHVHSFYARKAYLAHVAAKNAETRAMLEEEYHRAVAAQEDAAREKAQTRFGNTIQKMHHLVSTTAQPGIFNSPYAYVNGGPPAVGGVPVEAHLHGTTRGLLKSQRLSPRKSQRLPAITDRPPMSNYSHTGRLKALEAAATHASPNLSLQASRPYNMVHEERQFEAYVDRAHILAQHPTDFSTTIQEPIPLRHKHFQLPALRCDDEYNKVNEPLLRDAPDSLDMVTQRTHPHASKPFKTAIAKQQYFQESLNLEREYYLASQGALPPGSPGSQGGFASFQQVRPEQMTDA